MNDLLIYGVEYDLWRQGKYIGRAIWVDDENIGEAFVNRISDSESEVYMADKWKFSATNQEKQPTI